MASASSSRLADRRSSWLRGEFRHGPVLTSSPRSPRSPTPGPPASCGPTPVDNAPPGHRDGAGSPSEGTRRAPSHRSRLRLCWRLRQRCLGRPPHDRAGGHARHPGWAPVGRHLAGHGDPPAADGTVLLAFMLTLAAPRGACHSLPRWAGPGRPTATTRARARDQSSTCSGDGCILPGSLWPAPRRHARRPRIAGMACPARDLGKGGPGPWRIASQH